MWGGGVEEVVGWEVTSKRRRNVRFTSWEDEGYDR